MSRTLNLCQILFSQGRRFFEVGAEQRALRSFGNLSRLRDLPPLIAEQMHFYLGELSLRRHRFAKARRHLTVALGHDRGNAKYHYLLACAHDEDPRGIVRKALEHYRSCVELDPENAWYHCDAGQFSIASGRISEGLSWIRRAAALAPDDAELLTDVVRVLQEQGCGDEARQLARAARFRNSRNPAFTRLWNDCRFQELHQHQQRTQKSMTAPRAAAAPACLSFQRLTVETPTGRKLVRQDGPSDSRRPHLLRLAALPDKKHA